MSYKQLKLKKYLIPSKFLVVTKKYLVLYRVTDRFSHPSFPHSLVLFITTKEWSSKLLFLWLIMPKTTALVDPIQSNQLLWKKDESFWSCRGKNEQKLMRSMTKDMLRYLRGKNIFFSENSAKYLICCHLRVNCC